MSATRNANTYGPLETVDDSTTSAEMQIDDNEDEHEYKRARTTAVETSTLFAMISVMHDDELVETKSGEMPLILSAPAMTSSLVIDKTNKTEIEATSTLGMKFSPDNPYIETMYTIHHETYTHMADPEMEGHQMSEATEPVRDQQNMIINTGSGSGTTMAEFDKMEIESNGTIKEDKKHEPTSTYSSVLQTSNSRKRKTRVYDNTWKLPRKIGSGQN
ncbi:hypothetical protein C2G38_2158409 [Gigaspora rosea]|uniref:Uncharacterized protein n=1 Tax=Gigaspora rosea TaxID=44941 RepID=A0A397W1Z8_9GLOM|nr:hypothetical protein C2G38_2158409 [Gigaspora rosea]